MEDTLIGDALAGDRNAWNTLIARHNTVVERSLISRGVSTELAREAAHDAWIKLMERQRAGALVELRLPGIAVTQSWYIVLDRLRQKRRDIARLGPVAPELIDGAPSAERRLLASEALDRARRVFASLSPGTRRVFLIAYDQSTPHSQIADALGVSVQYVRQTLFEARKALRTSTEVDS